VLVAGAATGATEVRDSIGTGGQSSDSPGIAGIAGLAVIAGGGAGAGEVRLSIGTGAQSSDSPGAAGAAGVAVMVGATTGAANVRDSIGTGGQSSDSSGAFAEDVPAGGAGATDVPFVTGGVAGSAGVEPSPLAFMVKSTQDSYVCFASGEFHHHCNTQSPATAHLVPRSGIVTLNCVLFAGMV
jgi:hypothetical protein